jgi:hypothetical protein
MTCLAPIVISSPVATETLRGVNLAVYHVLGKIVSAMREPPLGSILVFIACLELILDGMAVGAERFRMTYRANLTVLSGGEAVGLGPAGFMVHLRPLIRMALAADGHSLDRERMLCGVLRISHDI